MGGPTMGWILKGFSYCSAKMWHCRALEERWDLQVLALPCRAKDDAFSQTSEPAGSCGCFGALWEALTLPRGQCHSWTPSRGKREARPFVWLLQTAAMHQLRRNPTSKALRGDQRTGLRICLCAATLHRGWFPAVSISPGERMTVSVLRGCVCVQRAHVLSVSQALLLPDPAVLRHWTIMILTWVPEGACRKVGGFGDRTGPGGSSSSWEAPPATHRLPSGIHEVPPWAVLLQPACEDAGWGPSSPICGLEADVALSLQQKRSCSTIYSPFFVIIFLAVGLCCVIFSSALPKYNAF